MQEKKHPFLQKDHIYNNKNTRGKVLNIASGKEIPINTLIEIIAKYLNYNH
ncbi:MAG: hypothetical protein STSR0004_08260 [Peptococcaceae bacterium]